MRGLPSLLLLPLPLLLSFAGAAGASGAQGAHTWCQGPSGACYSLHRARLPFQGAREACAQQGGALSPARGPLEIQALLALLGQVPADDGPALFWLGLARQAQQCTLEGLPLRGFSWEGSPPEAPEEEEQAPRWLREPGRSCTLARCAALEVRLGQPGLEPWGLREQPCAKAGLGYICKHRSLGPACPGPHRPLDPLDPLGRLFLYRPPFSRLHSASALDFSPPGTELTLRCPSGREQRLLCRPAPDGGAGSYWEGRQERLCSCPTGYWSPAEGACVEAGRCWGAQGGFLCLCATRGFRLAADPESCLRDHGTGAPSSSPPAPTGHTPNSTGQLNANANATYDEEGSPLGAGDEEKPPSADSSNYVFILITVAVVMLVLLIMAALQVFQLCFKGCSSAKAASAPQDGTATTAPLQGDLEASATCTDSENSLGPSKADSQESPSDGPRPGDGQEEPEGPCM